MLKKERTAALGDPVRGITTPFLQSFDAASPAQLASQPQSTVYSRAASKNNIPGLSQEGDERLNFFLTKSELEKGIEHSKWLSTPPREETERDDPTSYTTPEQRQNALSEGQKTAEEALRRIASLSLGNSKDRHRVNVQRCIDTFGRHNTDLFLPPKPGQSDSAKTVSEIPSTGNAKTPRVGPDTGSSEVQIAILTAKIKTLADFLETRGKPDKVNKRNLRLLVHRRQKLLQYLRRKERGGPRWQRVTEMLGLTEGTWKGEISL